MASHILQNTTMKLILLPSKERVSTTFSGTEPNSSLWAGLAGWTCKKITVRGIPNLLNYCTVFILNILYTVKFHLSGRWLSGSAWPFEEVCREFHKTNLP
jgi:hypothetical protein